ncbi:collagen alpha-1(III) chain-like [Choloepus didactylus]|uniref:collagen alpha-1(III) chain-like n=1 Tax=Choloepus didactylus TaxID=27675 RepID=UPI00189F86E7|nr:collagen alpha-1(III) chain-like [Choloepus didactylus]
MGSGPQQQGFLTAPEPQSLLAPTPAGVQLPPPCWLCPGPPGPTGTSSPLGGRSPPRPGTPMMMPCQGLTPQVLGPPHLAPGVGWQAGQGSRVRGWVGHSWPPALDDTVCAKPQAPAPRLVVHSRVACPCLCVSGALWAGAGALLPCEGDNAAWGSQEGPTVSGTPRSAPAWGFRAAVGVPAATAASHPEPRPGAPQVSLGAAASSSHCGLRRPKRPGSRGSSTSRLPGSGVSDCIQRISELSKMSQAPTQLVPRGSGFAITASLLLVSSPAPDSREQTLQAKARDTHGHSSAPPGGSVGREAELGWLRGTGPRSSGPVTRADGKHPFPTSSRPVLRGSCHHEAPSPPRLHLEWGPGIFVPLEWHSPSTLHSYCLLTPLHPLSSLGSPGCELPPYHQLQQEGAPCLDDLEPSTWAPASPTTPPKAGSGGPQGSVCGASEGSACPGNPAGRTFGGDGPREERGWPAGRRPALQAQPRVSEPPCPGRAARSEGPDGVGTWSGLGEAEKAPWRKEQADPERGQGTQEEVVLVFLPLCPAAGATVAGSLTCPCPPSTWCQPDLQLQRAEPGGISQAIEAVSSNENRAWASAQESRGRVPGMPRPSDWHFRPPGPFHHHFVCGFCPLCFLLLPRQLNRGLKTQRGRGWRCPFVCRPWLHTPQGGNMATPAREDAKIICLKPRGPSCVTRPEGPEPKRPADVARGWGMPALHARSPRLPEGGSGFLGEVGPQDTGHLDAQSRERTVVLNGGRGEFALQGTFGGDICGCHNRRGGGGANGHAVGRGCPPPYNARGSPPPPSAPRPRSQQRPGRGGLRRQTGFREPGSPSPQSPRREKSARHPGGAQEMQEAKRTRMKGSSQRRTNRQANSGTQTETPARSSPAPQAGPHGPTPTRPPRAPSARPQGASPGPARPADTHPPAAAPERRRRPPDSSRPSAGVRESDRLRETEALRRGAWWDL